MAEDTRFQETFSHTVTWLAEKGLYKKGNNHELRKQKTLEKKALSANPRGRDGNVAKLKPHLEEVGVTGYLLPLKALKGLDQMDLRECENHEN